jgi:hypothetical protein
MFRKFHILLIYFIFRKESSQFWKIHKHCTFDCSVPFESNCSASHCRDGKTFQTNYRSLKKKTKSSSLFVNFVFSKIEFDSWKSTPPYKHYLFICIDIGLNVCGKGVTIVYATKEICVHIMLNFQLHLFSFFVRNYLRKKSVW